MDWVKLTTNYYLDAAIMRAGEAAEILFTRALAYVGDQESEGVVPREALDRLTPTRGLARADALVREGLWEVIPTGWRFSTWDKHQISTEKMTRKRETGRARQTRYRTRSTAGTRDAVTNASSDGVTDASVTPTEVEEEVDAAAAATRAAAAAVLPGPIEVLRSKLQAHTPLRGLRFDTLRSDQLVQLEQLLEVHGDTPLIDVAVSTCRNPAPVHASAFLGTWAALPAPGQRLHVVRQRLCPTHATVLSPAGTCNSCVSDERASR